MTKQEKMYKLIEKQQSSGQTAKAFCERHQIKLGTFNYWLRKKRQSTQPTFVAVDVESRLQGKAELIYPNGVRLRLDYFNLQQIHQLINLG